MITREREDLCVNAVSNDLDSVNATILTSYKDALLLLGFDSADDEMEDDDDQRLDDEEEAPGEASEESDLCPVLNFTDEEYREMCRPWKKALVLTLPGKKTLRYRKVRHNLTQLWYDTEFKFSDIPNYYVLRFEQDIYRDKVLMEAPWFLMGRYLVQRRWIPNFIPDANDIPLEMIVWVRGPNLPKKYNNSLFQWRLGKKVGTSVDMNTPVQGQGDKSRAERGIFARVTVEVDLRRKLQRRFISRNELLCAEY